MGVELACAVYRSVPTVPMLDQAQVRNCLLDWWGLYLGTFGDSAERLFWAWVLEELKGLFSYLILHYSYREIAETIVLI